FQMILLVITHHKWQRFALHPANYNSQIVKEFYSNLTNPAQKVREVVVRGKAVLYSEQNINKYFKLEGGDCAYQTTLATISDNELTDIMKSLTEEGSTWNYKGGKNEWTIRRMSLKPIMRVWYQFIKHSLMPTSHNEFVNKTRLVLLHCITAMQHVNVGKIISKEINECSTPQLGMLYFPCLITGLCRKILIIEYKNDDVMAPSHGFDEKHIETLLKGNTGRRTKQQMAEIAAASTPALTSDVRVDLLCKLQKDWQTYWSWNDKFATWMENQFIYCFPKVNHWPFPLFPREILGKDPSVQVPNQEVGEPSTKKKKRMSKQKFPSEEPPKTNKEELVGSNATNKILNVEEAEVTSLLNDGNEGSEEKGSEENTVEEEEKTEKEGLSGDDHSEDGIEGSGQAKTTTVEPSGEIEVVPEIQSSGVVAEGQKVPVAILVMTDKGAEGDAKANPIASPEKKKKPKAKTAQKTKADKSSDTILEPRPSAESGEKEGSDVSKTIGPNKRKERGEPTRKSNRLHA
ncbi:hypothetical protein A2U01_0006950, partial [Trifolium medium]|nr:hypothetical protein [Trifolium medium]